MKKVTISRYMIVLSILFTLLIMLIPGCSARSKPIEVRLSFSESPTLGKPVQVTATFNLSKDHYREIEHDVTVKIVLSEGFQLVGGNLEFQSDFIRGQTYTINPTVVITQIGVWKIGAQAIYSPGAGATDGGSTSLWVTISENGSSISDRPPQTTNTPYTTNPPDSQTSVINGPSFPLEVKLSFSEEPV